MDLSTPVAILTFLQSQGYFIIFFLMFLERPPITYIVAFASSLGFFNIYFILLLTIAGAMIADSIFFLIGKIGKKIVIKKYVNRLLNSNKIKKIKLHLKDRPFRTLAIIKIVFLLPIPGIILAGAVGMPFRRFILYSSLITIIYSTIIVTLGFYSGMAFLTILRYLKYSGLLIGAMILLIIGIWSLLRFISKRLTKNITKI